MSKITVDDLQAKYKGNTNKCFAEYETLFPEFAFSSVEQKQSFVDEINNSDKYSAEKLPWAK